MTNELSSTLAVIAIAGFAIQQLLEWWDGLLTRIQRELLVGVMSKKTFFMTLSMIGGAALAGLTGIRLLHYLPESAQILKPWDPVDLLVTALVIGSGTEGLSIATKYAGHLKDAHKAAAVSVEVLPKTVVVAAGGKVAFSARVTTLGDGAVVWAVVESSGGTIDAGGMYTAPAGAGSFHVRATSTADPSQVAVAKITVR